jgi:FkbM family methyltransferase
MIKYLNAFKSLVKSKSQYKFSFRDSLLFQYEKNQIIPRLNLVDKGDEFSLYKIEDLNFYWMNNLKSDDLPWLYNEIFNDFKLNPSSYSNPKVFSPTLNWVIDAGACEGFFSIHSLMSKIPLVIALEPIEELEKSLNQTLKMYKTETSEFKIIKCGLGRKKEKMNFSINNDHLCDSGFTKTNNDSFRQVDVTTIDLLFNDLQIKSNHGLIKMDIEGAEMDALIGASRTLQTLKPNLAIAVYHDYNNAILCKEIILKANPNYKIEFRGMYNWFHPPRPYMLFAY